VHRLIDGKKSELRQTKYVAGESACLLSGEDSSCFHTRERNGVSCWCWEGKASSHAPSPGEEGLSLLGAFDVHAGRGKIPAHENETRSREVLSVPGRKRIAKPTRAVLC